MTNKIKDYLGVALIIGVLAIALSALWYAGAYSRTSDINFSRSFAVTGEGKVVAVPDIAQFSFSILTEGGKDLAPLQKDNVTKTNAAIDFLKKQGVDAKDISTEAYNIQPRYQNNNCGYLGGNSTCPPPSIVGYTINQTVSVKVRDLAKVGTLLSGVVNLGANSTSGPNFTIDDPVKVQSEARSQAIIQAKSKAEAVAKAGGFGLGRLISVDEGGAQPVYYNKAMGMGGADMAVPSAAPAPTIEPGSQDIVVDVTLRYEIN